MPSPGSSTKTRDKHSASSPVLGESDSPKKSRRDVDAPSKKALTLKKPWSYHMNKKEIEKEEKPTKVHAVSFLYFSKSYFFSLVLACHRNPHLCAVDVTTSGNTNLALAIFSCLWESLIVFAKDWLHVWA